MNSVSACGAHGEFLCERCVESIELHVQLRNDMYNMLALLYADCPCSPPIQWILSSFDHKSFCHKLLWQCSIQHVLIFMSIPFFLLVFVFDLFGINKKNFYLHTPKLHQQTIQVTLQSCRHYWIVKWSLGSLNGYRQNQQNVHLRKLIVFKCVLYHRSCHCFVANISCWCSLKLKAFRWWTTGRLKQQQVLPSYLELKLFIFKLVERRAKTSLVLAFWMGMFAGFLTLLW